MLYSNGRYAIATYCRSCVVLSRLLGNKPFPDSCKGISNFFSPKFTHGICRDINVSIVYIDSTSYWVIRVMSKRYRPSSNGIDPNALKTIVI